MRTPPQFIGGLVAHGLHVTIRSQLGGESLRRREATQKLAKADAAGWREFKQHKRLP